MNESVRIIIETVRNILEKHWCEMLLAVMALSACSCIASFALGKLHFVFFKDTRGKDDG